MPMMGTNGTQGVRNGRGWLGFVRRKTITAMQTITKASSVPMFTMSADVINWHRAANERREKSNEDRVLVRRAEFRMDRRKKLPRQ